MVQVSWSALTPSPPNPAPTAQNGNHVELAMEWLFANPEAAAAAEGAAAASQQQQDDEQLAQVRRTVRAGSGWRS